jgi:hypothetical protein
MHTPACKGVLRTAGTTHNRLHGLMPQAATCLHKTVALQEPLLALIWLYLCVLRPLPHRLLQLAAAFAAARCAYWPPSCAACRNTCWYCPCGAWQTMERSHVEPLHLTLTPTLWQSFPKAVLECACTHTRLYPLPTPNHTLSIHTPQAHTVFALLLTCSCTGCNSSCSRARGHTLTAMVHHP